MNIGRLLDFCYLMRWLPKALRQVSHTAVDRAAAAQRDDQSKSKNQRTFDAHPSSLLSSTQETKPKEVPTSISPARPRQSEPRVALIAPLRGDGGNAKARLEHLQDGLDLHHGRPWPNGLTLIGQQLSCQLGVQKPQVDAFIFRVIWKRS